ncbi:MAG: glycerophosphodiester phosphodiesterase [Deltaproteobacteria bacterium]|nr:MAG: glycerophosphodiester phosphodiesterase [Deltaproteobacteria bacterium]
MRGRSTPGKHDEGAPMPQLWTPPKIIAHRGASGIAPENTLIAFEEALRQGAGWIEFDVQRCRSGEVIVLHDATVDRTTNGKGRVREMTLSALKRLDAGGRFSPHFRGEPIPTLEEVFESFAGRLRFNIEIKSEDPTSDGIEAMVVSLVERFDLVTQVIVSSFNPIVLARIQRLNPALERALLLHPDQTRQRYARFWYPFVDRPHTLHPEFTWLSRAFLDRAHRGERQVNVWTVNEASDLLRMLEWGVDGIITNHPARLLRLIEDRGRRLPDPQRFG